MSFYGEDSPTDATETRRKYLQKWDDKLDAYAYNDRNDLKATDGTCARVRRSRIPVRTHRAHSSSVAIRTVTRLAIATTTTTARAWVGRDVFDPDANDE